MLRALLVRIVALSVRSRWALLLIAACLVGLSIYYVSGHFSIDTNIDNLISRNLPWRQHEIEFEKAFPHQQSLILAVIDAPTPELAESAATRLTERLQSLRNDIREAFLPDDSQFFRRNGLLFLSQQELSQTLGQLTREGPLLRPLAADQSVKGVMDSIALSLRGVQFRRISLDTLTPRLQSFADAIRKTLANEPAYFSWRELLNFGAAKAPLRQFITIFPVLDFSALQPGAKATEAIRQTVADLQLANDGVRVRLTGPVPISDDEFQTLQQGAFANTAITVVAVLVILWLALHSARIILAVFASVAAGLAMTAALGLAMVKALNPISVAFFVLFVGIGVDFGLQYSVSYRAERYEQPDLRKSLLVAIAKNGGRLVLAALATAAGFLSFLPTAYRGVAELGQIAGAGMIIALVLSLTVLPALLYLLNPPAERRAVGYPFLLPLDYFLERHRIAIVASVVVIVFAATPLLYWLRFDFNPMNLRNPKVESVATYLDLAKDPQTTGNTAEVLAPSLTEADDIAKRLSALPEVARTMTLTNFIPEGQDQKQAAIHDAATQLNDVLNPTNVAPAPSDEDVVTSIQSTAASLNAAAATTQGPGSAVAKELAGLLGELAKAPPKTRQQLAGVLIPPLKITLQDLKDSLNPEHITMASLPPRLVSQWQAPDGKARVSVIPKGDPDNNAVLHDFVYAVLKVAPTATGATVAIQKAGETVVRAFIEAGVWALFSIAILLWLFLRRLTDVGLTLFPLILAALVTLEICAAIGFKLNFANIIALPVLLGLGVAFKIYYIVAWRQGQTHLLASPLTRAIFFSGMTTAVAFGSLWLSSHPGTSSMGQLLALSLTCTMAAAILFQPLLMGPPKRKASAEEAGRALISD